MEIFELSDTAAEACMRMVRRVALAVRAALRRDGVVIAQLNGRTAGQTVGYVHFHVIPRWAGQRLRPHARVVTEQATLESFAERIRSHLNDRSND